MTTTIRYYHQCEDAPFYYEVGDIISTNEELEILRIENGTICMAYKSFDLGSFIRDYSLPDNKYDLTSHYAFANSIIECVSPHWIHEMYILFVLSGGDKARCRIIP